MDEPDFDDGRAAHEEFMESIGVEDFFARVYAGREKGRAARAGAQSVGTMSDFLSVPSVFFRAVDGAYGRSVEIDRKTCQKLKLFQRCSSV